MTEPSLTAATLDRSRPMRDQIYGIVRHMILTAQLEPGAVVDEKSIAQALHVSRTPVREAVKKLSDERLVEVRAQSGTLVSRIDRAQIEEAHIIRRALEVENIGHAVVRLTPAQVDRLEDIHVLHARAIAGHRYPEAIGFDDTFHHMIAEVSGYPMLWRAIEVSKAQLDRCRHLMLPRDGMGEATLAEHRAILDALVARDPDAARAAMRDHLERAFGNTIRFLEALADLHPADQPPKDIP